jgi:hypothetical protein
MIVAGSPSYSADGDPAADMPTNRLASEEEWTFFNVERPAVLDPSRVFNSTRV